jgi:ABC-type sulfate/molybdate transport systems ATPase subunit
MTVEVAIGGRLGTFEYDIALKAQSELMVLYGHSGAGKTLTLRAIAGLRRPDHGRIAIGGRGVFDASSDLDLPPQARRTGYVVQDPTLFPHLTVEENVLIGVEESAAARQRQRELEEVLHIERLGPRRPHELSGGQQQRVALARALVRPTEVLLLDEPFSALDEELRQGLRGELVRLQRSLGVPIVFVTHDLREAHLIADRIAVMDEGRVLQLAPREVVFREPASRRVAELTGVRNLFEGTIEDGHVLVEGLPLRLGDGGVTGGAVDVGIRSERCNLRRFDPDDELPPNCMVANIVEDLAFGNTHTLRLVPEGPGPTVEVEVAARPYEVLGVADRSRWVVELPPADLQVMPRAAAASGVST